MDSELREYLKKEVSRRQLERYLLDKAIDREEWILDRKDHGSIYSYKKGCRCDECRNANRLNKRAWRERRT